MRPTATETPPQVRSMGCDDDGLLGYASVVEEEKEGVFWVRLKTPWGFLARGPYVDTDEAWRAASALDLVALRRWGQDARGAGSRLDFLGPSSDV
jgi:hypothetical protein